MSQSMAAPSYKQQTRRGIARTSLAMHQTTEIGKLAAGKILQIQHKPALSAGK
jgi:hypothetical protein